MKNLLLIILLVCFSQCNTTVGEKTNKQSTNDLQKGQLIGETLDDIKEQEHEMNVSLEFEKLESHLIDINDDGIEETIILEKLKDWNDPGDFHRITVIINAEQYSFFNVSGWIEISNYEIQHVDDFLMPNLVNSKYIVCKKADKEDIVLFSFGYTYASQPGLLSIIRLSDEPTLIFNKNNHLYAFEDFNIDGTNDIKITNYDKDELLHNSPPKNYYKYVKGWYFPSE